MNKNKIIGIALIIAAVILSLFGFFVLPEDIVTQFNFSGETTKMNKIPALIVPFLITTVSSILTIGLDKDDERNKKYIFGAILGILLLIVMIGVNI